MEVEVDNITEEICGGRGARKVGTPPPVVVLKAQMVVNKNHDALHNGDEENYDHLRELVR